MTYYNELLHTAICIYTYSILTSPGTTDDGDDLIGMRSGIPAYIECTGQVVDWTYIVTSNKIILHDISYVHVQRLSSGTLHSLD